MRFLACSHIFMFCSFSLTSAVERNYPYIELEGIAESYEFHRNWRAYYWRVDFTLVLRDDTGRRWRVISREPTPWSTYRLGPTYPDLKVDWAKRPRVRIIGVKAVDRMPAEFYDQELNPMSTVTALIARVRLSESEPFSDFYVNNWFHHWGDDTDRRMLGHYANDKRDYSAYGFLKGIGAPFDVEGQKLIQRHSTTHQVRIFHGRVLKADNPEGFEVRLIHLLGRNLKTLRYEVVHGNPNQVPKLNQSKPKP